MGVENPPAADLGALRARLWALVAAQAVIQDAPYDDGAVWVERVALRVLLASYDAQAARLAAVEPIVAAAVACVQAVRAEYTAWESDAENWADRMGEAARASQQAYQALAVAVRAAGAVGAGEAGDG